MPSASFHREAKQSSMLVKYGHNTRGEKAMASPRVEETLLRPVSNKYGKEGEYKILARFMCNIKGAEFLMARGTPKAALTDKS